MNNEDTRSRRELFLSSLDRALDTFGVNVHDVVYYKLREWYGVSRDDIPLKPELFVKTVDQFFGVGAAIVSRAIRKELEAQTGIKDLGTKDLLTALRTAYREQILGNL